VTGRRGRKGKQLLDNITKMGGYWKLKEAVRDRILWRNCSGRGYGAVAGQTMECRDL